MYYAFFLILIQQIPTCQKFTDVADVQTIFAINPSCIVAYCHNFLSVFIKYFGCRTSDISHSLNGNSYLFFIHFVFFHAFISNNGNSPSGCFYTPYRTTYFHWFARNHTWNAMPLKHTICIHNPRHDFPVCIHIRSRNVLIRPYNRQNSRCIPPCQADQFISGQFCRIYFNPAFRPSIWYVNHRTFK